MNDSANTSDSGPAPSINTAPPPVVLPGVAASRLIIDAIQPTITEIRAEIAASEKKAYDHFKLLLTAFGGGFILLIGAFAGGFLTLDAKIDADYNSLNNGISSNYKELDDKFESTQELLIKINTQLQYLAPQPQQPDAQPLPSVK